uniref:MsrB domain-containing protein n=1 Tax=Pseudo-nitzschia australis TaxID=44445 RepID=A0A7S4EKD2_9STRA|mmetsp:Transcript_24285/g.53155  ORF Transcript_24285/g.53155 Transcript_24285/m.53155 type:complete len:366 (+) Transcript_24285:183-1280(+)|eukprot:CAMPEP_0168186044 /NCGR_PEP_ID=MMETSP0139_2-20121125/14198_1 /TAXON_ID=44445 /ORGANISM="Pseudo-nitzschia australis, Strain 10249 10 AB" /LENGTH=365 /DNA_ID=CAMNT_0008107977 /DNA_START=79 /DNA_END=1176 /DNA_ORIENTATION=+
MRNVRNYHRHRSCRVSHSAAAILAIGMIQSVWFLTGCLLIGTTGSLLPENTNGHFAFAFSPALPARHRYRYRMLQQSTKSISRIASKKNIDNSNDTNPEQLGFDENDNPYHAENNNMEPGSTAKAAAIDPNRRQFLSKNFVGALAVTVASSATTASAANASEPKKSRTEGYAVQHTEREWAYILSGPQYNILRRGGTERQRSSILNTFTAKDHVGTYVCAGCRTPLFASEAKFNSRTGWPSFASALVGVEQEDIDPIRAYLDGREVRCGTCGGHLGDLFNDGWLYPGTLASSTGKRYCIDGAALIFKPATASSATTTTTADVVADDDGSVGTDNSNSSEEASLIYGDLPPPNKVIQYEPATYRGA